MTYLKGKLQQSLGRLPKLHTTLLGGGEAGNYQTVYKMKKVARKHAGDVLVRRLAESIILEAGAGSHNHIAEAKAIGRWVQKNMLYAKDPDGIEQLQSPPLMIERIFQGKGVGDCDDMALLAATLLLTIGIRPKFRMVRYRTEKGGFNHIYVVVYESDFEGSKKRLVIDPIIPNREIGFEVPHTSGREISV